MYQIPRNSLVLMLVSIALVILPHILRLPIWVTLMSIGCCFWRVMVYQGRWSLPGKWAKTFFVFGSFLGVGLGYGTLLGLEPWVGMLIIALVLKLLEMHRKQDAYTVVVLAYFVALTEFLFEQSIPYTLYMYIAITLITSALIGLNQAEVSPKAAIKKASSMLAQAMPLMILLFVMFPRIGPLWTVPLQTDVARTGVTDSMSPGNIAELVQSDALAFRATFEGEVPSYNQLYWRGLVLSYFNKGNQSWTQERPGLYGQTLQGKNDDAPWKGNMEYVGEPIRYSVILEPTNQNWIFSLTLPEPTDEERLGLVRDFRFYSFQEIRARFQYELTSYLDHRTDVALTEFWRHRYTLLPDGDNPRARRFGSELRADSLSDDEFLSRVLRHYMTEGFAYTLKPPTLEGDTIDQFLFETRRGFCEHFAGSFVYLMRSGGLPARVVVGYQGGEYNRRGNYVAVRQFDAHAWAEVWMEGRGWIRVDPTSVVAPERIQEGLEFAVEGEEFLADVGLSLMKFRSSLWITELRLQFSALNHYWDAWVVGYSPTMQMELLNRYLGDIDRKTMGIYLIGGFFVIFALVALLLLMKRSTRKLAPVEREYLKYCQYLADQGLARAVGEGPLDYGRRVSEARPDLAPGIRAVTNAYVRLNFAEDRPEETDLLRKAYRNLRIRSFA
ncbi:MAG: DUF3488 domain-containing transglutaminase family protein [Pseudomonadales bacterium]|nr:DUF3488 domain-containing transglutaminase family protein [Pseudomonadales bacterium]MBO6595046.1 DUF3488 domain-containing transglutaminase family protein [Pseudomonadales bacterium]MBO6821395.1 DUF3488 domain-containing transglutaminase family protein [Pseudomonadales bacterium]